MLPHATHKQQLKLLMESYHDLLDKIDSVMEQLKKNHDDVERTKAHKTNKIIRYWFDNYGKLPKNM